MYTIYQIAKKITGGSRARSWLIKAEDGTLLSSGEDKLIRWEEHVNEVLSRPVPTMSVQVKDPFDILVISTEKFTEVEVRKVIKALRKNKLPDMYGISAEMLKAREETVVQWMCIVCNQVWESDFMPDDWKNGTIVYIPKKGNLSNCYN